MYQVQVLPRLRVQPLGIIGAPEPGPATRGTAR
jgi:hypothetical protein